MIRKVQFESQERRINQVLAALKENGINSIEEANEICGLYSPWGHLSNFHFHSCIGRRLLYPRPDKG